MANPWLDIPLADYEGHMSSSGIEQLAALSELFGETLHRLRPESIAILGVAGGNGLEHVNSQITKRVVGIDINADYLQDVRQRFGDLPGLELHCVDLAARPITLQPVNIVHAALVFEHAGISLCLENALSLVAMNGTLSVVLQQPSASAPEVGESPYPSLQKLKDGFTMIEPARLQEMCEPRGYTLTYSTERLLPAGKSFWMGRFLRVAR